MKTLAIMSQKGGSGKSTTAVHLAAYARQAGLLTALVDTDPQASAARWNERRPEAKRIDLIKGTAGDLLRLKAIAMEGGARFLIFDTAPHSNRIAAEVAELADLILAPCRAAMFDLEAVESTLSIARLAGKPAVILLNAVPPRSRIGLEAAKGLKDQGHEVCPVQLTRRAAYEYAVIDGRSVHEFEPKGKAAEEMRALFNWLRKRLELSKKPK